MCLCYYCSMYLQILCLAEQIEFTERCEQAVGGGRLDKVLAESRSKLESYTSADLAGSGPVLPLKLKALILDTIHNIEVVQLLEEHRVSAIDDWLWAKQLR